MKIFRPKEHTKDYNGAVRDSAYAGRSRVDECRCGVGVGWGWMDVGAGWVEIFFVKLTQLRVSCGFWRYLSSP